MDDKDIYDIDCSQVNDYDIYESCISTSQFREFELNRLNPRSVVKSAYDRDDDFFEDYSVRENFNDNKLLLEEDFYGKYVVKGGGINDNKYMKYNSSISNNLSKVVCSSNIVFDHLYGSFSFGKILVNTFLKKSMQLPFFGNRNIKYIFRRYPLGKFLLKNRSLLSNHLCDLDSSVTFNNDVLDLTKNFRLNEIFSSIENDCNDNYHGRKKNIFGYSEWYRVIHWYRINNRILRRYNYLNFIDIDLSRSMFLEKRFFATSLYTNYVDWLVTFFNVKFSNNNGTLNKNIGSFTKSIECDIARILDILKSEKKMKSLFLTFCKSKSNLHVLYFYKKLKLILSYLIIKINTKEKELKGLDDPDVVVVNTSRDERYKEKYFNETDFIEFKNLLLRKNEFVEEKLEGSVNIGEDTDTGINSEVSSNVNWYYLSSDYEDELSLVDNSSFSNVKSSELRSIVNINNLNLLNSNEFIVNRYNKSSSELEGLYCDLLKESDVITNSQLEEEDFFFFLWK